MPPSRTPPGRTAAAPYSIRLDPWAPEYEGAIQLPELEEEAAPVETSVETADWRPIVPAPRPFADPIAFVDGVRRIEHRLLVEQGPRTLFGLLGSYAVGATQVQPQRALARVVREKVERVACVGGGLLVEPLEAPIAGGGTAIAFVPQTTAENTPVAPMQCLQNTMRRREAELAETLAEAGGLVFLDGPLTFVAESPRPVVGFVKRLLRTYLPPAQSSLLKRLAVGERTPLFLIEARRPRYSWYLRVGCGRPIDSPLSGIVRLETSAETPLAQAREWADLGARALPRFASSPERDPRAPQNLYPIGGLEAALRHRLGDALVIRRAIEARLHQEALA